MSTGACGIDCTVCRLHVLGVCSTCGAGTSREGRAKLEAQRRLFNQECSVLACAVEREVGHCLRDCDEFPCAHFSDSEYPFSEGFRKMQQRRRDQAAHAHAAWPETAPEFWARLAEANPAAVARRSQAVVVDDHRFRLASLHETWLVDPERRTVTKETGEFGGEWDRQLPFLILAYLVLAEESGLAGEMASPRDLVPGQDCFRGHHAIELGDLEQAFGRDGDLLRTAGEALGGRVVEHADAAVALRVFPKLPVEILLWVADDEFPARISVLLDRHTLRHLPADGVGTAVNLLGGRLLQAAQEIP